MGSNERPSDQKPRTLPLDYGARLEGIEGWDPRVTHSRYNFQPYYTQACIDRCHAKNALWMLTYWRCNNVFVNINVPCGIHSTICHHMDMHMYSDCCATLVSQQHMMTYWVIHNVVDCHLSHSSYNSGWSFFTLLDNVSIYSWIWLTSID